MISTIRLIYTVSNIVYLCNHFHKMLIETQWTATGMFQALLHSKNSHSELSRERIVSGPHNVMLKFWIFLQ